VLHADHHSRYRVVRERAPGDREGRRRGLLAKTLEVTTAAARSFDFDGRVEGRVEIEDPDVRGNRERELAERALPVEAGRDDRSDLLLARLLELRELAVWPQRVGNLLDALLLHLHLRELLLAVVDAVRGQHEREHADQGGAEAAE